MVDDIQAVILSDLKASSIAKLRAIVKVPSLLQLIDEWFSTDASCIEAFIPKRQILDRCQKTRCPYRVKIRDAQAETSVMRGVAVSYIFDDFCMVVPKMCMGHAERQEYATACERPKRL